MVFVNKSRVLLTGCSLDDSIRDECGVVCLEGKDNVDVLQRVVHELLEIVKLGSVKALRL